MNDDNVYSIGSIRRGTLCQKSRELRKKLDVKDRPESTNIQKAVIARDAVIAALVNGVRKKSDIANYVASRMDECGYDNDQQEEIQCRWLVRYIYRYIRTENRFQKDVVVPDEPFTLDLDDGRTYRSNVSVIFPDGRGGAEAVAFKTSDGTYEQKKEFKDLLDIQLWVNMLMLRSLGYKGFLKSSIYYLKNPNDSAKWAKCPPLFDNKQVAQMTDFYDPDGKDNLAPQLEEALDKFKNGLPADECSHDCSFCDYNQVCNYIKAPIYIPSVPSPAKKIDMSYFTQEQKYAAYWKKGDARIIAVAGAGKTAVVTANVCNLILSGADPSKILVSTFTRAAAKEMKIRIESTLGVSLDEMMISTIHGICLKIIQDGYEELGYSKPPRALRRHQEKALIAEVLKDHPIPKWTGTYMLDLKGNSRRPGAGTILAECFNAITKNGKTGISSAIAELRLDASDVSQLIDTVDDIMDRYEIFIQLQKDRGLVSFDRMLPEVLRLFDENPGYMEEHYPFQHIIIDESQDTSDNQMGLIKRFRDARVCIHGNMTDICDSSMWVGDDYQAIYENFLGVGPGNITNLDIRLGRKVTDIKLTLNHRSVPNILKYANCIIKNNKTGIEKTLTGSRPDNGKQVLVQALKDEKSAINALVMSIAGRIQNGERPSNIEILAYSKAMLLKIQEAATVMKIPTHFGAPEVLMNNCRITAILKFSRVIYTQDRSLAMHIAQVLTDGALEELEKEEIEAMIDNVLDKAIKIRKAFSLDLKKKLFMDFVKELIKNDEAVESFIEDFDSLDYDEIIQFCKDFALYGDDVTYRRENEYEGVHLTTIHSSKGTESPIVYVYLDDLARHYSSSSTVEEGNRLFYVACTRARDELEIYGCLYTGRGKRQRVNRYMVEALAASDDMTLEDWRKTNKGLAALAS